MAAIAAAKAIGIPAQIIQQTLEEFPGLEHRLEFVREKDGVRYYNDSKGTNVGAVVKSLASFSVPVILLAGGVDKGGDYGVLRDGVEKDSQAAGAFRRRQGDDCQGVGGADGNGHRRRHGSGGARRPSACAAGRRGLAVSGMLKLRHVSQLCRAGKSF